MFTNNRNHGSVWTTAEPHRSVAFRVTDKPHRSAPLKIQRQKTAPLRSVIKKQKTTPLRCFMSRINRIAPLREMFKIKTKNAPLRGVSRKNIFPERFDVLRD